jgi:hypothetical protein
MASKSRIARTGEDVAGASHVGGKPVDFVEAAVDYMWHEIWITKIAGHEGISL